MRKIFTLLVLSFLYISCGNDGSSPEDNEKPEMTISFPLENTIYSKGDEIKLTGTFSDNVGLNELVISLISPVEMKSSIGLDNPWEPGIETIVMSGKMQELESVFLFDEPIPFDCQSGSYSLKILLNDKAGNQTINAIAIEII